MSGRFTSIDGGGPQSGGCGGGVGDDAAAPPKLSVLEGTSNDDTLSAEEAAGGAPDVAALHHKLAELRQEHRDLDDVISRLASTPPFDQLQIQRLKKRKLAIKDQIIKIESALLPDIIA